MGDGYGPMIVARRAMTKSDLLGGTIAVPGTLTSAFLALRLYLGREFPFEVVPFDQILEATAAGEWNGKEVAAGLIIHEGQLTYATHGLQLIADMGAWWKEETGLPLPLGANAIRRDLGREVIRDVNQLLRESIEYGLQHRAEALRHALQYGRDLDERQADEFVGMYVNDWTVDFGPRGCNAVRLFLQRGYEVGALPELVIPEFVDV